ncbi:MULTISPECIES: NTP transferase domain-containing protein [Streptomyces]|uniref:NTP transferase domain-containing protein n=1 Tax=Streptomyces TaxID=1883 RepID=UPI001FF8FACD|nr:NTP transferase domain-containing protein [Streptomyces sp. XM4011]MCK1817866.1 NTP transferase domain-containing protein [Streptomyces sp. XM4011]
MTDDPPVFDAIVLAGGAARRLGGADKAAVTVGGRPLLDRVLDACRDARRTVVVGPPRPTRRPVRWVREDPPGGGPLAALAAGAGAAEVTAPLVAVLATDLPFLTPATPRALLAALPPDADGVLEQDADGRDQPLTAVYRTEPLRRALAGLPAVHGAPLRTLLPALTLHRRAGATTTFDCDTWAEIAAARVRIKEHGTVLDEWIAAVNAELDIDPDLDRTVLLDAARDVAHGVARPAAPLTTFLIGYAAAQHGIGPAEAARRVAALAARWAQEQEPQDEGRPA